MVIILVSKRLSSSYATGKFFHRALTRLGHSVVDVDITKHKDQLSTLETIRNAHNADLLITLKGHGVLPQWISAIDCPTVLWYQDDAYEWETARKDLCENGPAYDYIFYFDHAQLNFLHSLGLSNVKFLPCATDPIEYKYIPNTPKIYDVSFVGNVSAPRKRLLDRLSKRFNVTVRTVFLDDMVKMFNASKISINLTVGRTGYPLRIFEALGMRSFLLTSHVPDEYRLFENKKHLVYYTEDDIEDLIQYYLDRPALRESIANQGYMEVLQKHTFDHRMCQLLKEIT